tara:strand:+ start:21729 stop:22139 length:411 start_codon:yes stop_codon:yes gene_type:complete
MMSETFKSKNTSEKFDVDLFSFNEWFINEFKLSPDIQIDDTELTIEVEWTFFMEIRSWGVKSIGAYATKVSFTDSMVVTYYDKDDQHHEVEIKEDQLNKLISEFEVETNDQRTIDTMFHVENVEIDIKKKSIEVQF